MSEKSLLNFNTAILAMTALVGNNPTLAYFQGYLQSGLLPVGIIALLAVSLITFFLPLYEIHREMVRQRIQYQEGLDTLARRIDEIARQLIDPSVELDSASAQKWLDALKWMRQVYQESNQFPTYPFNRNLALKLTFSQFVPLLTLAGLPKGILDAFANFISLIQPR